MELQHQRHPTSNFLVSARGRHRAAVGTAQTAHTLSLSNAAQHTSGLSNQFMQGLVASYRRPSPSPSITRSGEARADTPIQAKLQISQPGDRLEREADRVADMVMNRETTAVGSQGAPAPESPVPISSKSSSGVIMRQAGYREHANNSRICHGMSCRRIAGWIKRLASAIRDKRPISHGGQLVDLQDELDYCKLRLQEDCVDDPVNLPEWVKDLLILSALGILGGAALALILSGLAGGVILAS